MTRSTGTHEVVCIVPARSGSVRIPDKNLVDVGGASLLQRAVRTARAAVGHVVVSTDSARYAEEARRCGAQVPALRPAALASSTATTEDVVRHVLRAWCTAPVVCVIQPTAPFITRADVRAVLDALRSTPGAASAFTARRIDPAAAFAFAQDGDGVARPLAPHLLDRRTQDLPVLAVPSGGVYAAWSAALLEGGSLVATPAALVPVDERAALDIDEPDDLDRARRWAEAA